jgi:hypothetical protein
MMLRPPQDRVPKGDDDYESLGRSADCRSDPNRYEFCGAYGGSGIPMSSIATLTVDGDDEQLLAQDMIDVHGALASGVARGNVRVAALAGQRPQARHWLRVLGMIQQMQTGKPAAHQ